MKNEEEKKIKYNAREMKIENGTFTSFVFLVNGGRYGTRYKKSPIYLFQAR